MIQTARTAKEGMLVDQGYSATAATVGNALYPTSGEQLYRVMTNMGTVDVLASTGDEAADKALAQRPGAKVGHIAPAPQTKAA